MINTLFLTWGLIPILTGLGLIFRPRTVSRLQTQFRKKMEKMEKRLLKAHRATGLAFLILGSVLILSWFHPIWIYNAFLVVRIALGAFFPELFQKTVIGVSATTYI